MDASSAVNQTTAVAAASFEIRSDFECDLELTDQTVNGTQTWDACGSITSGPSFVIASTGSAHLTAGVQIVLRNGFNVRSGGELTLTVDPALEQN